MNELLDELKTLLSTALSSKFTTFYKGEVVEPARSYLPALMVFGNSTRVIAKTTTSDQYQYNITVKAVIDVMTGVKEAGTSNIIQAQETLYKLMEERNSDNQPIAASVLGVFRKGDNIEGTRYLFNNDIEIEYSRLERGEFHYVVATMTLTLTTDLVQRAS